LLATWSTSSLVAQQLQTGILIPNNDSQQRAVENISYLPEEGLNLYDKPQGEVVARLGRDRGSLQNPNFLLNIFLYPRDRKPELVQTATLAPLSNNRFALPFVELKQEHVLLFNRQGPYFYWVKLSELDKAKYHLAKWPEEEIVTVNESRAGLVIPDFEKLADLPRQQFAYVPKGGLPLYNAQQQPVANLSKFCPVGKYTDGNMRMFILPDKNPNDCINVPLEQLHHWSDDAYVIPYFDNKQGFVRLLKDDRSGTTWAKISDITDRNFLLLSWKDYFISRRSSPLFAAEAGLNLRESPYADAKRVTTISGEEMLIYLVGFDDGFCEGQWCKVKVKVYLENPCATQRTEVENFKIEYEGWIKLMDDSGLPNVYINTKGC